MESSASLTEDLSVFPPDDEEVILSPDQCFCCKLSKTQGTFFALKGFHDRWEWRPWEANVNKFRAAAGQGCRRCGFVFEVVLTYMDAMGFSSLGWVRVWNGANAPGSLRALVYINLSCANPRGSRTLTLSHSPDSPYGLPRLPWNIATSPTFVEDPTCDRALAPAKTWIQECLRFHKDCRVNAVSRMPRRILELSDSTMFLRDSMEGKLPSCYASLSHCWGEKGPSIRLTKSSVAQLKEGVYINTLPKTFAEAAKVCLQLGIYYLWIDALCIYQDNLQDWTECASEMASIYQNAQVTIVARSARSSDDGLRWLAKDRFRNIFIPAFGLYVREHKREFGFDRQTTDLWPLMSRAWAFQEQHLSIRTLAFGAYQTVWQCRNSCHTEEDKALPHKSYLQSEPEDPISAWHDVVGAYSGLQITYENDRLPALAALAEKMSKMRRDDVYLAGLWSNTLLQDLQWRTVGYPPPKSRCIANAPSWSWASAQGKASFGSFNRAAQLLPSVELLDISYVPDGPPHMGQSTEASLTIKGKVGRIGRCESASYSLRYELLESAATGGSPSAIQATAWQDFDSVESTTDASAESDETLVVLFLTLEMEPENLFKSFSGLLLRKTSAATAYERIGWLEVSYKGEHDQWTTEDAFSYDSDSSFSTEDLFISSETPLDKHFSTLSLESVTIV